MYDEGERPRSEPEIIPPDRNRQRNRASWPNARRTGEGFNETHHIYVTRIGPLTGLWLALGIGAVTALALVLMFGAFVFLLPLLGAIVLAGAIARWWRGGDPWRRP